jgi:hypothetical protein
VGITIKGGSINVLAEDNDLAGPLKWVGISAGEPSGKPFMYPSARDKYQAKYVTLRNNHLATGAVLWSCQGCSAVGNTGKSIALTQKSPEKSTNLCVSESAYVNKAGIAPAEITTTVCRTSWPSGIKEEHAGPGWDVHGNGPVGGLPRAPAQ